MSQQLAPTRSLSLIWPLAAILISLILILIRVLPIGGPIVFADEYQYAARISALHQGLKAPPPQVAALSNWLYLRVYEIVFAGNGSFLIMARILNAVISAMSAGLLVYVFHSSKEIRKSTSALAAALAIGFTVTLSGAYAGYFMPEAPYFAAVCLLLFCVWKHALAPRMVTAIALGLAGGIANMTKTHGLLLLPATLVVVVLIALAAKSGRIKATAYGVAMIFAWLACTTTISILLGHSAELNPLGEFYTNMGSQAAANADSAGLSPVLQVLLRHLATLALIIGMPLILCSWLALKALFHPADADVEPLRHLALLLGCTLLGMILITTVFTVGVSGKGPYESLTRLHGRYYEHIAVLAACVGIVGGRQIIMQWSWKIRLIIGVAFIALLMLSLGLLKNVSWESPADFALTYAMFATHSGRYQALFLATASGIMALAWPRHASSTMASALLLWFALDIVKMEQLRWHLVGQPADRVAAMIADVEAGSGHHAKVEIIAQRQSAALYRAAFHLLQEDVEIPTDSNVAHCGAEGIAPKWVITIGQVDNPCAFPEVLRIDDVAASLANQPGIHN
jgi:hypothetical protein